MSEHVLFCSDLASRDETQITRLQGWCVGSVRIRGLTLQTAGSEFEPLVYGMKRDDVENAYPGYARARVSGFKLFGKVDVPPTQPDALCVEIENGKGQENHVVFVNLDTRDVQTIELNEESRARGAK